MAGTELEAHHPEVDGVTSGGEVSVIVIDTAVTGAAHTHMVAIHASPQFVTEWLEEG